MTIPRHVAIVMDGNGRWAKKRFMPRFAQPNVSWGIVLVDTTEDNSLLAFVVAPHPFDPVADANLR